MFQLGILLLPLLAGFFIGTAREKNHFKSLRKREQALNTISWRSNGKKEDFSHMSESALVTGHVVIGQDYFKSFLAGLINIVGGRVGVYESLLDRGSEKLFADLGKWLKNGVVMKWSM